MEKRRIKFLKVDDISFVCIPVMIKKEPKWFCLGHMGLRLAVDVVDVLEDEESY